MKTSELTKLLRASGCRIVRHGKKHDIWWSPKTGKEFLVWRHPSKEIPKGTLVQIMKDAGLQ